MQLQNIIIFMGPPGSGKGTQTKLLSEHLGYAYFSTGALSREYAEQDTDLGWQIKSFIDKGMILPIDIIKQIFVKKFESLTGATGVILDGFPRTIQQAELLEELVRQYEIKNTKAIFLNVDKDKLIERITKRKTCPNCQLMYKEGMAEYEKGLCSKCGGQLAIRADDDPAIIEKRFEEYLVKTAPVKKYYEQKGLLIHVNGDQPIDKVRNEIINKLGLI